MRTIRHIAAALAALAITGAAMAQDNANPLRPLGTQARPLIVFAPGADDARLVEQRAMIEKAYTRFAERDQVLISVAGDTATVLGPPRLAALLPETMNTEATLGFLLQREPTGLNFELELFEGLAEVTVPVDLTVGLGLAQAGE